jgi:hypothetical protein
VPEPDAGLVLIAGYLGLAFAFTFALAALY